MSLALDIEGVVAQHHCELDVSAAATIRNNIDPNAVSCDVREYHPEPTPGGLDILVGGPPCQPWSQGGVQKGKDDPRNLWPEVLRLIDEAQPRVVLMENVHGILHKKHQPYLEWWWGEAAALGYTGVLWKVLGADYGSPQRRGRVWFVLYPEGAPWGPRLTNPPPATHADPRKIALGESNLLPWVRAFDQLNDGCCGGFGYYSCVNLGNRWGMCGGCVSGSNYEMAPNDTGDEELSPNALKYLQAQESMAKHPPVDAGGVFAWDELKKGDRRTTGTYLAPTVPKGKERSEHFYFGTREGVAGPGELSCPIDEWMPVLRQLSVRDIAKLQSVPQWYRFHAEAGFSEEKSQRAMKAQVGNGIDVNMGRAVGRYVLAALGYPVPFPDSQAEEQHLADAGEPDVPPQGLWPLYQIGMCRNHATSRLTTSQIQRILKPFPKEAPVMNNNELATFLTKAATVFNGIAAEVHRGDRTKVPVALKVMEKVIGMLASAGSAPVPPARDYATTMEKAIDRFADVGAQEHPTPRPPISLTPKKTLDEVDSLTWLAHQRKRHGDGTVAFYEAAKVGVTREYILPSAVVGSGGDEKAALKWLDEEIRATKAGKRAVPAPAQGPWTHWGVTEADFLKTALDRYRKTGAASLEEFMLIAAAGREATSYPQDGSRGQALAWDASLAEMLEGHVPDTAAGDPRLATGKVFVDSSVPPGPGVRSPIYGLPYADWLVQFAPFGLTEDEMVVLSLAKRLKSSYRRANAAEHDVEQARYDAALDSLIAKGFLGANKAINKEGRKKFASLVKGGVFPSGGLSYLFKAQWGSPVTSSAPAVIGLGNSDNWFGAPSRDKNIGVLRSPGGEYEIRSYVEDDEEIFDLYFRPPGSTGALTYADSYDSADAAAEAAVAMEPASEPTVADVKSFMAAQEQGNPLAEITLSKELALPTNSQVDVGLTYTTATTDDAWRAKKALLAAFPTLSDAIFMEGDTLGLFVKDAAAWIALHSAGAGGRFSDAVTSPAPTRVNPVDAFRDLMVAGSYGAFTTPGRTGEPTSPGKRTNTFTYLGKRVTIRDDEDGTFLVFVRFPSETRSSDGAGSIGHFSDAAAAVQAVQAAVSPAAPAPAGKKAPTKGWYVWATEEDGKWVQFNGPYRAKSTAQQLMNAWSTMEEMDDFEQNMATAKELKKLYGVDSGQTAYGLGAMFAGLDALNQVHLETLLGVPFISQTSPVARPAPAPTPATPQTDVPDLDASEDAVRTYYGMTEEELEEWVLSVPEQDDVAMSIQCGPADATGGYPHCALAIAEDGEGVWYTMSGPTGTHRLFADPDTTDASRLWAHWKGFVETGKEFSAKQTQLFPAAASAEEVEEEEPTVAFSWGTLQGARDLAEAASGKLRVPHYSVTRAPALREVGMATGGVLLLDEVNEFESNVLKEMWLALQEDPSVTVIFASEKRDEDPEFRDFIGPYFENLGWKEMPLFATQPPVYRKPAAPGQEPTVAEVRAFIETQTEGIEEPEYAILGEPYSDSTDWRWLESYKETALPTSSQEDVGLNYVYAGPRFPIGKVEVLLNWLKKEILARFPSLADGVEVGSSIPDHKIHMEGAPTGWWPEPTTVTGKAISDAGATALIKRGGESHLFLTLSVVVEDATEWQRLSAAAQEAARVAKARPVITKEDFDSLQKGQRIWIDVVTSMSARQGARPFEVGRKSYSKKYKVHSKRLYPVNSEGNAVTSGAKWVLYKRDTGVSLGHGNMATDMKGFYTAHRAFGPDAPLRGSNPEESGQRLERATRLRINDALVDAGLDGNGRFDKPERGYVKAVEVLQKFGIELATIVNAHAFGFRPSGVVTADVAYTNTEDLFSPIPITNSMLRVDYTDLGNGRFESVAYMS